MRSRPERGPALIALAAVECSRDPDTPITWLAVAADGSVVSFLQIKR
jgi:hypothetical protein